MAELWTDYTDSLIDRIDGKLKDKYKFSLRDFLSTPDKYSKNPNIEMTLSNMKEDIDKYIDDMITSMPQDSKALQTNITKCNSVTIAVAQTISNVTKQNKIPFIKPVTVDRDFARDETIYIDNADQSMMALINKLAEDSKFVCDFSTSYKDYTLGEWFFSGTKNYTVTIYLEPNEVLSLETSKEELDSIMEASIASVKK